MVVISLFCGDPLEGMKEGRDHLVHHHREDRETKNQNFFFFCWELGKKEVEMADTTPRLSLSDVLQSRPTAAPTEAPAPEATPVESPAPATPAAATTPPAEDKPLRENMIQNAINFLGHESTQSSPLTRRIAFLEHKGLTSAEIAEALKRYNNKTSTPSTTSSSSSSAAPVASGPVVSGVPSANVGAPSGPVVGGGNGQPTVVFAPYPYPPQQTGPAPPPQKIYVGPSIWKTLSASLALSMGVAASSVYLAQKFLRPKPSALPPSSSLGDLSLLNQQV